MTSLISDAALCTSELGRLLYQPKSDWSGRAHVIEAKDSSTLGVKHVDYKLLIVMTPKPSLQVDARRFELVTRFRELHKLHGQLSKLHQQLYLRTPYPVFPEPKWLGSTDASTVAERRSATETFITFLLEQDVLRKSRLLQLFVEKAEERPNVEDVVEPSAALTIGNSLLDTPTTLSEVLAPVIAPDNEHVVAGNGNSDFEFEDVGAQNIPSIAQSAPNPRKMSLRSKLAKLRIRQSAGSSDEEFMVAAGRLLAAAKVAEEDGAYETAFHGYKDAASVLLEGMESEPSLGARNALRLKTAQFLEKAEAIYRTHLRYDNALVDVTRRMEQTDRDVVAFQSAASGLRAYRLLGVLPDVEADRRVFLVEERETGRPYIMKLLEKRELNIEDNSQIREERVLLPACVPHMVHLVKFFNTQSFIILVVDYIPTGRLWSFLCRYFSDAERRHENQTRSEILAAYLDEEDPTPEIDNPYKGRHLRFSVSADCDRLAVAENEALEDANDGTEAAPASALVCAMGEDAAEAAEEHSRDHPSSSGNRLEPARYLLVPASVETIILSEEEEAPSPIRVGAVTLSPGTMPANYCCSSLDGNRSISGRKEDGEVTEDLRISKRRHEALTMPLARAMSECRGRLEATRRCWPAGSPLPESLIVHWTAQVVSMLYVLHAQGVVMGNLHPDNLLLSADGNVVVTYHAKWHPERAPRALFAGYAAPECLEEPHLLSPSSDVWSLGALLFELLIGRPLCVAAPHGIGRQSELPLDEETELSLAARHLLPLLLAVDPEERATLDQARAHPFYSSINWLLYDNPHGPAVTRTPSRRSDISVNLMATKEADGGEPETAQVETEETSTK